MFFCQSTVYVSGNQPRWGFGVLVELALGSSTLTPPQLYLAALFPHRNITSESVGQYMHRVTPQILEAYDKSLGT